MIIQRLTGARPATRDGGATGRMGPGRRPDRRFLFSNQTQHASVIAENESRTALNVNGSIEEIAIFITAMLTPQISATTNRLTSARREEVGSIARE